MSTSGVLLINDLSCCLTATNGVWVSQTHTPLLMMWHDVICFGASDRVRRWLLTMKFVIMPFTVIMSFESLCALPPMMYWLLIITCDFWHVGNSIEYVLCMLPMAMETLYNRLIVMCLYSGSRFWLLRTYPSYNVNRPKVESIRISSMLYNYVGTHNTSHAYLP